MSMLFDIFFFCAYRLNCVLCLKIMSDDVWGSALVPFASLRPVV